MDFHPVYAVEELFGDAPHFFRNELLSRAQYVSLRKQPCRRCAKLVADWRLGGTNVGIHPGTNVSIKGNSRRP